jgi:hypothetical protein
VPEPGTILVGIITILPGETEGSVTLPTDQLGVTQAYVSAAPVSDLPATPTGRVVLLHVSAAQTNGVTVTTSDGSTVHGHVVLASERKFVTNVEDTTTFTVRCLEAADEPLVFKVTMGTHRRITVGTKSSSGSFGGGEPVKEIIV